MSVEDLDVDLSPDSYTLEIESGGYMEARQKDDGSLQIQFNPEQAERFEGFAMDHLVAGGGDR